MRYHKALLSTPCTVSESAVTSENDDSNDDEPMSTECALGSCANESPSPTEEKCVNVEELFGNVESNCISFVLGLREKHMLPSTLTDYRDLILTHVQSAGDSNIPLSEGLCSALNIERHCESVGKHFESEYALLRYLKQTDKIVMPQTLVFNSENPKQTFQYVPVLQVLHKLLCRDDVVDHFASRHPRHDNLMGDFCDGFLFKGDSFFAENPSALRIHLYCDEFEVCNPIGPKKGKHKITAFYYTVGNFHPKWRSQTRWIFLAILIKHQFLVANGLCYEAVLQPLLTDLKHLQEHGVEIVTNSNQKCTVKGKLVSVSADNLSAHTIAGFQQHFHAGRICRTCLADYADISEKFGSSDFRLRTADIHSYHLEAVSANSLNAAVYGVKGPCSFSNNLPDFDVTQRFPHDIMHDLLEGVLPRTTRLVLAHFIQTSQLDQLNKVLTELNLAHGNKPNKLKATSLTSRITGTAVQQLELFLLLPRLLVPFVTLETENRVWCVYLYLREICDIVLAHTVDVDNLSLLEDLVCRYLQLYVQVFGPENVIPKHHYMVHYAHHLRLFGPLRHMWCMRFEAKHKYFKTIATASQSFQNVTKTLAKRHQMRQSWEMASPSSFCSIADCKKSAVERWIALPAELQESLCTVLMVRIDDSEQISSVSCLTYDGCCLKVNNVYVLNVVEEERVPVFLHIKKIMCVRGLWLLCGMLLVPKMFECKYHAFAVDECGDWLVVKPTQLVDHSQQDLFSIAEQQYVSLRYAVVGR